MNHVHRCHGKFKKAFTAWPKWRCSVSCNMEEENLAMLPPLDGSLRDKLMLFKMNAPKFPVDMSTREGWQEWDEIVKREMPGFARFVDNYDTGDISLDRYGVQPWHDSSILNNEAETSVESIFLQILTHDLRVHPDVVNDEEAKWSGTAVELKRILESDVCPSSRQTRQLLSWNAACGTYLGRLAKRYPDAINFKMYRGARRWTIDLAVLDAYIGPEDEQAAA